MDHEKSVVWMGSESSGIWYFEMHDRAKRMAENNPGIVQKASAYTTEADARFGDYDDYIQAVGNLAIVPIQGSMMAKENWMTKIFGIMTYDTISNVLASIVADGGIETVLFDIDSGGGQAKGIDTAGEAIRAAQDAGLRIVSHTSGTMLSAAYWIGSMADVVAASENAEVGSVGVIAVHQEESERNKKEGVNVTVLRKGEKKALATPYEKLSEEGRKQVEASMERSYQQFIGTVSENRGIPRDFVQDKIATGDVFGSEESLKLGMIDEVIAYNDLVSRYASAEEPAQHGAGNQNWSEAAMAHKQPIVKAGDLSPEEAAIAVAAGANPDDLVPRISAEEGAEEAGDEAAEVTVVEGSEETPETEAAAEEVSGEEANAGGVNAAAEASALQSMVSSLNEQLIEAKMEARTLSAKVEELTAGNTGLRQIAVEQTQRLRVSLGMPSGTEDLELMSDASLVTAHQSNLSQFMERFNIGATSVSPEKDNTPMDNVTRLQTAAKNATRFK